MKKEKYCKINKNQPRNSFILIFSITADVSKDVVVVVIVSLRI